MTRTPSPAVVARVSLRDPFSGMNGIERRRAIELEAMKRNGLIADWWFEGVTLKLADDTRVTPDFLVQDCDGSLRFEETKGFLRDDARIKYAVARRLFPFPIRLMRWKGGAWDCEDVA